MASKTKSAAKLLQKNQDEILGTWVENQRNDPRLDLDGIGGPELERDCRELLEALSSAVSAGDLSDPSGPEYDRTREVLAQVSLRRERMGAAPSGTALSVISLKEPWSLVVLREHGGQYERAAEQLTELTRLVDTLGLMLYDSVVRRREQTITQQAEEMLEVSTPVIKVWDGVVAAPLIGTLDSERTQRFMERLLDSIVKTNSPLALIDITGVPAIDTQTAQHLIDTISAVRLLGAQVVLTGVRPSIAQTLVHLGINLTDVITRSSFADGLSLALGRLELEVTERNQRGS